jgi:hypothetical protein
MMADKIWIVTSYFNWCHLESKLANYRLFRLQLDRAGINSLTVEGPPFGVGF